MHMGEEADAISEFNLRADNAIRPDLHALSYARAVSNARGRVDHDWPSRNAAPSSASATSTSATLASQ